MEYVLTSGPPALTGGPITLWLLPLGVAYGALTTVKSSAAITAPAAWTPCFVAVLLKASVVETVSPPLTVAEIALPLAVTDTTYGTPGKCAAETVCTTAVTPATTLMSLVASFVTHTSQ